MSDILIAFLTAACFYVAENLRSTSDVQHLLTLGPIG